MPDFFAVDVLREESGIVPLFQVQQLNRIMENSTNSDTSCAIIQIIEDIKNKKKKPDKDSITREAIQQGLSQDTLVSLLLNVMVTEGSLQIKKGSYCINKGKGSNTNTQHLSEMPSLGNIDHQPWTEEYLEFKKFIHDELISLKASMAEKFSIKESIPVNHSNNYEVAYIRSMEERIISLERQLHQKQDIIDKLLTSPNVERKALFVEEAHKPKRVHLQHQIEKDTSVQNNTIAHKNKGTNSTERKNSKENGKQKDQKSKFPQNPSKNASTETKESVKNDSEQS